MNLLLSEVAFPFLLRLNVEETQYRILYKVKKFLEVLERIPIATPSSFS